MRIAVYSPRSTLLEPGIAQGGDPVVLHSLFTELRSRGHEIEVASRLNVRDLWHGRVPARQLLIEARSVRNRMRQFEPEAWLVWKPSRTYPDVFGWWQRPRRYVLLAAHTWQSNRMPNRWRTFLAWMHRQSLRRADVVTAERRPTFERLLKHGVEPSRLRLLPQAVQLRTQLPSQEEARVRLGLNLDQPIALCATRFTELGHREGKTEMILDLVSAVRSIPAQIQLVIAGDGPGRLHVEREVERLGLQSQVRLFDGVENPDLAWFYAACDLYAYPHPLDQPWTSILEAQACGRPVVMLRTSSSELTVDEGRSGLLADSRDEFREYLAAMTSDRSRCAEMGRAGRRYIAERHSISVRASQIEEALGG
jgi:glycosyltransferase involved in cell wall biosynthesis